MTRSEVPSEDRMFRLAVESSPTGMLLVDRGGTIVLANSRLQAMFGYDEAELLGQPVELLLPSSLHTRHIELREIFMAEPAPRSMGSGLDLSGQHKSGRPLPVEVGLNPLRFEDQLYVMASVVDIGERRKAAERLERYAADLERSNEDLDNFAYIASHDLRSPLEGIKNLAKWIREDNEEALPAKSKRHLDQMQRRVQRLEKLLDDLLRYSRAGRLHGRSEMVDVRRLARELYLDCNAPAGFVFEAERLPVFRTPLAPFSQVVRNLISNAIKHHDKEAGRIAMRCADDGDVYRFELADDGPGIAEEFHEQIFKMFETLQPRDRVEGSGMGLALIKRIVESYGGEVSVASAAGQGSVFRFTWPKTIDLGAEA